MGNSDLRQLEMKHSEAMSVMQHVVCRDATKTERRAAHNAALIRAFALPDDGTDYAGYVWGLQMATARDAARRRGKAQISLPTAPPMSELSEKLRENEREHERLLALIEDEKKRQPLRGRFCSVTLDRGRFRVRARDEYGGKTIGVYDDVTEANLICGRVNELIEVVLKAKA